MTFNLENGTVLDPEKALKGKAFTRYCNLEEKANSGLTEKEERELNRLRQLMVREFQDYFDE